jgi:hypothetical protein
LPAIISASSFPKPFDFDKFEIQMSLFSLQTKMKKWVFHPGIEN